MQLILNSFCAIHGTDSRTFLEKPVRIGKFIYASNGHIGIRVPDDGILEAVNCETTLKRFHDMFSGAVEYVDFPKLPEPEKCSICGGTKKEKEGDPCPDCEGNGDFYHGNHNYDCKECDGSGRIESSGESKLIPCFTCHATGVDIKQEFKIENNNYSLGYLLKIAELTHSKIQTGVLKGEPIRFVFEGGEGILMPLRS